MNTFDILQNRKRVAILDGKKELIVIDATLSETHSFSATATDFPVETGFSISDSIINSPKEYSLEGLISDDPGDPVDILQRGIIERTVGWVVPEELQGKINQNVLDNSTTGKPSLATFIQLEEIFDNKLPIQIQCDLKLYKNMVMTSLSIPRTTHTYRALRFSATFKQIIMVDVEYVKAPKRVVAFEINAHPASDFGKQSAEELAGTSDDRSQGLRFLNWTGLIPHG